MQKIWFAVLAAVLVCSTGCGSGDGDAAPSGEGETAAESDELSATLGIITTNIETSVGDAAFETATEGEQLVVGDRVKTDATGFAEVTYHDGSWMRVESSATLTIDELTEADGSASVETSIDTGSAWNRVRELVEPEDAYVLDTPVGSAAVRGTAFSVVCLGVAACAFSVLDGEVVVTPDVGDEVTLTAGQSLTVLADEAPAGPTSPGIAELSRDPFIAKNLELDRSENPALLPTVEAAAGPDLNTIFGGPTPVLVGVGTPELVQCAGADAGLVGRLDRRATALGAGWPVLDGEDLHATLLVVFSCGGTDAVLTAWVPSVSNGYDECVSDRLRGESPERLAALISGVDPAQVVPETAQAVIDGAVAACRPAPTTTTTTPRRSGGSGSGSDSGGDGSGGTTGDGMTVAGNLPGPAPAPPSAGGGDVFTGVGGT